MKCVNRTGSEFKKLVTEHNISTSTLELITHKYWIESGVDEYFPTNVYIQAQLGNMQYVEKGSNIAKLWDIKYSTPQTFKTQTELNEALQEARKYFPESAIIQYKNAKEEYVLSIKKPVKGIKGNFDTYFPDTSLVNKEHFRRLLNAKERDALLELANRNEALHYAEEDNVKEETKKILDRFNLEKPISLRTKAVNEDLRAIKANEWNLPNKIKETVAKRLDNYMSSKEGIIHDIDVSSYFPNNTTTADTILRHIISNSSDRQIRQLARALLKNIGNNGNVKVSFTEKRFGPRGQYFSNDHSVKIHRQAVSGNTEAQALNNMEQTVIHEVAHAITVNAIENDKELRAEALQLFKDYKQLQNQYGIDTGYAAKNVKEFVAEFLGRKAFREALMALPYKNTNQTLGQRILNFIKKIFGLKPTNTFYYYADNTIQRMLDAANSREWIPTDTTEEDAASIDKMSKDEILSELNEIKREQEDFNRLVGKPENSINFAKTNTKEYDLRRRNRQVLSQRFSLEELKSCTGTLEEAEGFLMARDERSVPEKQKGVTGNQELADKQEAALEKWAKEKGIWIENTTATLTEKYGKPFAAEGEATVYRKNKHAVVKEITMAYYIEPHLMLDRIVLHNSIANETAMVLTNIGKNEEGEFVVIAEQPFVEGERPTQDEIVDFMEKIGFKPYNKRKTEFVNKETGVLAMDIHDENVIKIADGFAIIDGDFRINTANYGLEGKRTTDVSTENQIQLSISSMPTFTFDDGTIVNTPFTPNIQQANALNVMDAFINSNETTMTLSGYAGTGKTSIVGIMAQKAVKDGKPVAFCATTNKAAKVLGNKVANYGFTALTTNKMFGISVEVDTTKKYDARNVINKLKEADIPYGTTIFIDEASMIGKEHYEIMNSVASQLNLKIIYIGDEAQLPPVGEDKISIVFRNNDGQIVKLTDVERTGDNAILKEATALRSGEDMSGETSFNSKGEGVAYMKKSDKQGIAEVVSHFLPGIQSNPDYFRILAFTNKAVGNYNTAVRNLLGYKDPIPRAGEPMTGYDNWGFKKGEGWRFINSEAYTVKHVGAAYNKTYHLENGTPVTVTAVPITLEDSLGVQNTFDFIDVKENLQNRQAANVLAQEREQLWNQWRRLAYGSDSRKAIQEKINIIDTFLFINDAVTTGTGKNERVLAKKIIDFGYALTIHKSQGSTFTHVLMDDTNIVEHTNQDNFSSWQTFDLGMEEDNGFVNINDIDPNSLEDLDIFGSLGISPEDVERAPEQATKKDLTEVDMRRQLRYVAMTRATDTVTVISGNIKKEGTPLEKNQSNVSKPSSKPVKPVQATTQVVPSTINQTDSAPAKTLNSLRALYSYSKEHVIFDEKPHIYYVDGKQAISVTQYAERIFGKKNIKGDYSHSSAIGKTMDSLYRDFFSNDVDVNTKNYPNLNDYRKQKAIEDVKRFKAYLDIRFGVINGVPQYKVITTEFPIAAEMHTDNGKELIAGTMDMVVIDNQGNIHIFDFKAKNHPITQTYSGKEVSDRRDYTAQLNLYKAILETNPAFKGKVKSLQLVWMDTSYPKITEAQYSVDENNSITVTDQAITTPIPIEKYSKFKTPSLKSNIEESIIPLDVTNKIEQLSIPKMQQVSFENTTQRQLFVDRVNDRYHYKETSNEGRFNEVATPLRKAGWHIEFYDKQSKNSLYTNDTMTISFEDHPEKGFFEVVKDLEDNYYSVHFKTKSAKALNDTPYASKALTDAEKEALFEAVAYIIPEGGKLSTWGNLSDGGIAAMERFNDLGFVRFDWREVENSEGKEIDIPVFTKNSNSRLTQQVINQINDVAEIPIFFDEDMEEFLNSYNKENKILQQAVAEQREMEAIKAKTQADGTFMKAPNGKDTNLTERQWLQVRTKAFKKWFGDWENDSKNASKVVDENGEPLVVYHGTNADFTTFKFTTPREAFYFGTKDGAKGYTNTGKIMPLFLNIKNPAQPSNYNVVSQFPEIIKEDNYDGIVWKPTGKTDERTEFVAFNPNQIKSATDNIGTFSTENDDIQMAVNKPYSKEHPYKNKIKATKKQREEILSIVKSRRYNNSGTDIVTLREDDNKYVYLIDHSSHALLEENQKENEKQGINTDLFGIRKKYNINKLTEDDIRHIARNIASFYEYSEGAIYDRMQELGITPEKLPGLDITSAIQRGIRDNGEVDVETGEVGEQANIDGSSVDSRENQGDIPFYLLRTSEGDIEVYGFIDPKTGSIFLDSSKIKLEHPIHEYTHLWDRVVRKLNEDLWNKGVELMKNKALGLWNEVLNNEYYGKNWVAKGIEGKELDFLIASEVHSRLVGEKGAQRLEEIARKKGNKSIVQKLKDWMLDVWKTLKATFSNWSDEELDKLTLEQFNEMTVRDFTEGIKIRDMLLAPESVFEEETQQSPEESSKLPFNENLKLIPDIPNYMLLNNTQEEIKVDAEWKVPILEDLDAQLVDGTEEEKTLILKKMEKAFYATSKEDYEKEPSKKEKEVNKNLTVFEKVINQIDTLLDTDDWQGTGIGITASEVRHIGELITYWVSDIITDLQTRKEALAERFPDFKSEKSLYGATRKKIVETIGMDNLLEYARLMFDPMNNSYAAASDENMVKADLIVNNWEAFILLAADNFAAVEGFGVIMDYSKGRFATAETANIDYDNFDASQDPDNIREEEGDEQEHWQVETKTIDVLNSMSALVRMAIHQCYILDKDGKQVLSTWGIPERVNPRKVVNSILRWTQGATSLEEMIEVLKDKQVHHPWLSQLVSRLEDHNEADLQSQFYGVFCKDFQLYSSVKYENGKYYSMMLNKTTALQDAKRAIAASYRIGEFPLIKGGKVNKELLGSKDKTNVNDPFSLYKARTALEILIDHFDRKGEFTSEQVKEAIANISGVCRILNYPIPEETIAEAVNDSSIRTAVFHLRKLTKNLTKAIETQQTDPTFTSKWKPFEFKGDLNIEGDVGGFLKPFTEVLEDESVSAFYDSGKMYQSYVTPSFLSRLMQRFNGNIQNVRNFIEEYYGDSEWFFKDGIWKNQWLFDLRNNQTQDIFEHKVELNFNKHNYMKNMTDAEYALSLVAEYFAEPESTKDTKIPAWFRVPIQSNKPSSDFIKFWSYRGLTYKENLIGEELRTGETTGFFGIYCQELSRISTVRMRNFSKKEDGFIKNFDERGRKFCFLPFLNNYLENTAEAKENRTAILDEYGKVSSDNEKLAKLLQRKVEGLKETALGANEEAELADLVKRAIRGDMDSNVNRILNQWEADGILEAAKKIEGLITKDNKNNKEASDREIRDKVENFLWNDRFATMEILQMTIGDIAFYKDAEDLQKRLSELHAPGIRGNKNVSDYNGVKVSDGFYRTVILKDFDKFISNVIENITEVFDRKIERAPENQKAQWRALRDELVKPRTYNPDGSIKDKGGKYWNINATDAQGFSSPTSYRKKAFIFGKWSKEAEEVYNNILEGKYTFTDIEKAFQPLKPFVYGHLVKSTGIDNAPITKMHVAFQAKNAEYLLIMADALMKGEEEKSGKLNRPNLLKAVYDIMEDSAFDGRVRDKNGNIVKKGTYNGKGIDTIQFESAIKSGLHGVLDIQQYRNMDADVGERTAYELLRSSLYKEEYDGEGNRVYNNYNEDIFVHKLSFDNYCLQQEVPAHFAEHSQSHGSQVRMIIPSDLDMYKDPNKNHNDEENKVWYEWTEPDGTKMKVRADEFKQIYEETIATNIQQSLDDLRTELYLLEESKDGKVSKEPTPEQKKAQNIALSKILQKEILGSPRYGVDLLQACVVDKKTGEFRIPKGDPIQAKRIEQLINSIIKNRVNKQTIPGGPIVQVSNFGLSKELNIRYKGKDGKLLMTRQEYEKFTESSAKPQPSYKEYIHDNQMGIAHFEVFIPVWSKDIIEKFMNEDGSIDVEAIDSISPELLKMISYRIPTEDKYSCAPMKVVGFMPREAGDAIMLPQELTEIDDSDFDVDKRYVMRKDIDIKVKRNAEVKPQLFNAAKATFEKLKTDDLGRYEKIQETLKQKGKTINAFLSEQVNMFLDNPQKMRFNDPLMKALWQRYKRVAYYSDAPVSGKRYRDNRIIDMTWAVLTNEMTADKILNPGGFEGPKRTAYLIAARRNPANKDLSWEELSKKSSDELKELSYTNKDLTWADTQVQFYHQNSAGSNLIGVMAVNKIAHATLEADEIFIDVEENCGSKFTIAGFTFGGEREHEYEVKDTETGKIESVSMNINGMMLVDPTTDAEGSMIGKTLGSLVSASADTAKDPILDLINVNMATAGMLTTMMRLGMPFQKAALFMSQDIIVRALKDFNRRNLSEFIALDDIVAGWISETEKQLSLTDDSKINTEELTEEELVEGIQQSEHPEIDYKVLKMFQKIKALTDLMRNITFATRFNSISSAVGPLIIDNLRLKHRIEKFQTQGQKNTGFSYFDRKTGEWYDTDFDKIRELHPIIDKFAKAIDVADELFKDMPAGSSGFAKLLAVLTNKKYRNVGEKIYADKKLLSDLSDFYQSAMLIYSEVINPDDIKYYIKDFPKEFNEQKLKNKYKGNALIDAIYTNVNKRTGNPFLQIKITGIDEQVKEEMRNAWIDLHKIDPTLSKKLFTYCFFRAGIGFSPKAFMSLVPAKIKEKIDGYINTYRNFPSMLDEVIIEQFVQNNWNDGRLAPKVEAESIINKADFKKGTMEITNPNDIEILVNNPFVRIKVGKDTSLWVQSKAYTGMGNEITKVEYVRIPALGNNGEYIQMDSHQIAKPLDFTTTEVTDTEDSLFEEKQPAVQQEDIPNTIEVKSEDREIKDLAEFSTVLAQVFGYSDTTAELMMENIKAQPMSYTSYIQKVYAEKGIHVDQKAALEKFNSLC